MQLKHIIPIILFLISAPFTGHADISELEVDGASYFDDENTTPVIYGGVAGSTGSTPGAFDFCADGDTGGTETMCNNCGASRIPCNENRIFDTGHLTLTFRSSVAGTALVKRTSDDVTIPATNGPQPLAAGSIHTYTMEWDSVCTIASGSAFSTCELSEKELISENLTMGYLLMLLILMTAPLLP
ncbi:MAG: hypothetical protein R2827_11460 [Bdellovibrionales bacterium]